MTALKRRYCSSANIS